MANSFKNAGLTALVANTAAQLYLCPADTQSVIHALYLSNVDGVSGSTVDITVDDASNANAIYHIGKQISVPENSTLILDKPINLEAGDKLFVQASSDGDIEAFCSILEIT
jgi:hypothetical protein